MHLAATALTEFWDPSDENLILGPWCVPLGKKNSWKPFRTAPAPDPWENRAALHRAYLNADVIYEELLPRVGRMLNEEHRVNFPVDYWRIVVGPWLSRFIHFIYDRKERLNLAYMQHPGLSFLGLDPAGFVTPRDSMDFHRLGFTDLFNMQIFTQLHTLEEEIPLKKARSHERPRPAVVEAGLARRVLGRMIKPLNPRIVISEIFPRRRDHLRLMTSLKGKAAPFIVNLPEAPPADARLRRRLPIIAAKNQIARAVAQLIPSQIPTCFIEGYRDARGTALGAFSSPPKVMVSSTGWLFNEALKLAGAEFSLQGTRLIGSQHGGGYGVDLDTPTELLERRNCHEFITWGWDHDGRAGKTRPLPSPHTQRFRTLGKRISRSAKKLYFVTNGFPLYPYLLYSWPIGFQVEKNYEDQRDFIRGLQGEAKENLLVRAYPEERGWHQKTRLTRDRSGLEFDTAPSFEMGLPATRLLVIDCVGTSFLEAIAYGVPTITFLAPRFMEVRHSAASDFKMLRDCGILWDSPEKAAKRASDIYRNPWTWWDSAQVVKARERWRDRYAGLGCDWLGGWRDCLLDLARS